jgi:hypothetical protein
LIVYFDTVRREKPVADGGELVKLDWSRKTVLKTIPLRPSDPDVGDDPNPRGNTRGGKGIRLRDSEIYVGTYHTILVFGPDLTLKRRISNNLFVNIHEMCFADDAIWASSTAIDAAVLVDLEGRTLKSWWPREEPLLQAAFGLRPSAIDKEADNRCLHVRAEMSAKPHHTHLNSVFTAGGRVYALLNKLGVVVQIEPDVRVAIEDVRLRGGHSPAVGPGGDRVLVCASLDRSILVFELDTGRIIRRIPLLDFAPVAALEARHPGRPFNASVFVRGLDIIDDGRILAGVSPATLLEIDTQEGRLLDLFQYSAEVGDAVHGIVHAQ